MRIPRKVDYYRVQVNHEKAPGGVRVADFGFYYAEGPRGKALGVSGLGLFKVKA